MAKYTIRLDTSKRANAGTNAEVEARILGTKGVSAWRLLDNPGDDREQGSRDYYQLHFEDSFGDITDFELRARKDDEDNPNWLLGTAWICKVDTKQLYALRFNQWIDPKSYTNWVNFSLKNVQDVGTISDTLGLGSPFLW